MLRRRAWELIRRGAASAAATPPTAASAAVSTSAPRLQDEPPAAPPGATDKTAFLEAWSKTAPSTLNAPYFSADWLDKKADEGKDEKPAAAATPSKLTLNFYMPSGVVYKGEQVDLALIPAVTGDFGVMPGHVPTVAQLRPGVVAVHKEMDKDIEKYFVSSGFAFVHADSTTDVCAVEAVKVDDLDPEAVRAGLAEYTAKLGALQGKGDDYEIAAAQIGVEVYSAMNAAVQ